MAASVHCLCSAAASANTTCSFNRNILCGNEDTFSASSIYFVHTVHCCVRPDSVAVVVFWLSKRSFSDDGINLLKISPFGVIPSDIHIVNESFSNQLNQKDFSSLKCVNISHTCSSS